MNYDNYFNLLKNLFPKMDFKEYKKEYPSDGLKPEVVFASFDPNMRSANYTLNVEFSIVYDHNYRLKDPPLMFNLIFYVNGHFFSSANGLLSENNLVGAFSALKSGFIRTLGEQLIRIS